MDDRLICLFIIFAQFILICVLLDIVVPWFKKKDKPEDVHEDN